MKYKQGQILLITVMLLATIMTVLLSVTFQSTTDTQVTKLEEESQKALAAAESAIEVSLKKGQNVAFGSGGSSELSSLTGFSGGATISSTASKTFTSPLITKDSSYTFYLGDYNSPVIGVSTIQDVTVCFNSGSAIEITLVKTDAIRKYVVDSTDQISNDLASSGSCGSSFPYSYTVSGATIGNNGKVLLVKVLFASTRLYFSASSDLPLQGKTVTSEAKSITTDVSKKVVLFQSYPQIPAEFFTTTF
jgi:hypothetical protein